MILNALIILALVWILFNIGTWLVPQLVLFHPESLPQQYKYQFSHPFEEQFVKTPTGKVNALHFKKRKEETKGVILFFHGNAGNLANWGHIHDVFTGLGYDLFIYDYANYGKSTGQLNEQALYGEALACYEHLREQYPAKNIILYGRSLGCALATYVGTQKEVNKIILEAPFASVPDVFYQYFPFLPRIFWFKYNFPNKKWIKHIQNPLFIIHGTHDGIVPIASSKKLIPYLPDEENYFKIEGGGHNDLITFPEYHRFLRQILGIQQSVQK